MKNHNERLPVGHYWPYTTRRKTDELKRKADRIVATALRSGRLLRSPCKVCGAPHAEVHHEDYGKPLDVVWLCRRHHQERHRELDAIRKAKGDPRAAIPTSEWGSLVQSRDQAAYRLSVAATELVDKAILDAGLTRYRCAELFKMSTQTISTQFKGGIRTLRMLAIMAEALGYDVEISLKKKLLDSPSKP